MTLTDFHIAFKMELDKSNMLNYPSFEPEEIDYWYTMSIRKFVKSRTFGTNFKKTSFQYDQKRSDDLRTAVTLVSYTNLTPDADNVYTITYPTDYWFAIGEDSTISFTDLDGTVKTFANSFTEATISTVNSKKLDSLNEYHLNNSKAKPLRYYGENNNIFVVTDGTYTLSKYELTYIKKPVKFDITKPYTNLPLFATNINYNTGDVVWYTYNSVTSYYLMNANNMTFTTFQELLDVVGTLVTQLTVNDAASYAEYTYLPEHTHDELVKLAVSMALENIADNRYQTYSNEVATME